MQTDNDLRKAPGPTPLRFRGQTPRTLIRRLSSIAFNRLFNPRFAHLQRAVRGMLNPVVYRQLYRLAYAAPDLPIIEVGAGRGAGSIALALGMKESGKTSKLIV